MIKEFDPYEGFIGLDLRAVSFTRFSINLEVEGNVEDEYKSYRLSASSNICLTEDKIFSPETELDFSRPDSKVMARIFSFLEQTIVDFKPLKKFRACKLEFSTGAIFIWERMDEIVDNLLIATDTSGEANGTWWLIDDLP